MQVTSLDLRTNVLAAYVGGNRAHEVPAVMEAMKISPKDSFEIGFNTACGLLAAGDYAKAHSELELAQRLGEGAYLTGGVCGLCSSVDKELHREMDAICLGSGGRRSS